MKIIFLGTPSVAVPSLNILSRHHDVALVVTQPDRPRGRGRKIGIPEVKEEAQKLTLPIWQPASLKGEGCLERLGEVGADILAVVAYGLKIPDPILELCPHGAVNLHFSLLPAYRGAAPINWAMINGDDETGTTTFQITSRMDEGPIYLRHPVPIRPDETAGQLGERLASIGAGILDETLAGIASGTLKPRKQDESGASKAPKLTKENGRIAWESTADEIVNLIRGVNPWPGAFTELEGKRLKIWEASQGEDLPLDPLPAPGTVISASPRDGLIVAARGKTVAVKVLQEEGRKRLAAHDFLVGHRLKVGSRFH